MGTTKTDRTSKHKFSKGVKIAAGILAFAFLMGVRDEFSELWIRVLLAAIAGGIFGLVLWQCQKRSDNMYLLKPNSLSAITIGCRQSLTVG